MHKLFICCFVYVILMISFWVDNILRALEYTRFSIGIKYQVNEIWNPMGYVGDGVNW